MGYNWKKADAWRKHPLLTPRLADKFPGFGIGLGLFLGYLAYEKMTAKETEET